MAGSRVKKGAQQIRVPVVHRFHKVSTAADGENQGRKWKRGSAVELERCAGGGGMWKGELSAFSLQLAVGSRLKELKAASCKLQTAYMMNCRRVEASFILSICFCSHF